MDLKIEKLASNFDNRALIILEGRLNAVSAPDLKKQLKRLVKDGHVHIIVDLSSVSFLDSSGLAALVSGLKATREADGALKLAGVNEQARQVFKITRLDQVFELYPDRDAAVKAAIGDQIEA